MPRDFNIYTLEIAGQPVLAVLAKSLAEASGAVKVPRIRDALYCFKHADGKALWDGKMSELFFREATEEERETWAKADNYYVSFLVPVCDLSDDATE